MINFNRICRDYEPDDTIFSEEDAGMNRLKHIIFDRLTEVEKRVIILYAELGSVRKVGEKLGVSASTAFILIRQIKNKIKQCLET